MKDFNDRIGNFKFFWFKSIWNERKNVLLYIYTKSTIIHVHVYNFFKDIKTHVIAYY